MSDEEPCVVDTKLAQDTQSTPPSNGSHNSVNFSAVVKLFVARSRVSYKMPWQRQATSNATGSGFLIEGRLLITNVHVVQNATSILARRHGSARKYPARILCMGWQCDLALLTIDNERFWENYVPVQLGGVPELRDSVICVGYPSGGDNVSVTCGVVSRVNVRSYSTLYTSFLTVQIDAAINSGNSGCPVFFENRVVGVARSTLKQAQNIGYIITIPVLKHFLDDYHKHGRFLGICSDPGFKTQTMENMALRRYHSMPENVTGIYVHSIAKLSPFYGHLQEEDILLKVDDVDIGDDGTIVYRQDERIDFTFLFSRCPVGNSITLRVLRDGAEQDIGPVAMQRIHNLVPRLQNCDCIPSYYIVAGFVFQPLTEPLMKEIFGCKGKVPTNITKWYTDSDPESREEQVVLLTQIMPSDLSIGYPSGFHVATVEKLNGNPIFNIKHLAVEVEKLLQKLRTQDKKKTDDPWNENRLRKSDIDGTADVGTIQANESGTTKSTQCNRNMLRFDLGNAIGKQYHVILDPKEVLVESKKILDTYKIEQNCCAEVIEALKAS